MKRRTFGTVESPLLLNTPRHSSSATCETLRWMSVLLESLTVIGLGMHVKRFPRPVAAKENGDLQIPRCARDDNKCGAAQRRYPVQPSP